MLIGDCDKMAITPVSDITTFGPIPQPISTFSLPLRSTRLLLPESVLVKRKDFSFGIQLRTNGDSGLCYLSRRRSSRTGAVPTDNFLWVSPVKMLIIWSLLSFVPTMKKLGFRASGLREQTRASFMKVFSCSIFEIVEV